MMVGQCWDADWLVNWKLCPPVQRSLQQEMNITNSWVNLMLYLHITHKQDPRTFKLCCLELWFLQSLKKEQKHVGLLLPVLYGLILLVCILPLCSLLSVNRQTDLDSRLVGWVVLSGQISIFFPPPELPEVVLDEESGIKLPNSYFLLCGWRRESSVCSTPAETCSNSTTSSCEQQEYLHVAVWLRPKVLASFSSRSSWWSPSALRSPAQGYLARGKSDKSYG